MEIVAHKLIASDNLQFLSKLHDAIDSTISLHYSGHTRLMTAHELFAIVARLVQRRVKIDYFLCLFAIQPNCYKLEEAKNLPDYSPFFVTIAEDVNDFNKSLEERKVQFIKSLNRWIDAHPDNATIPFPSLDEVLSKQRVESGIRISKSPAKITKARNILKNDSSKFKFVAKDKSAEQLKNNGLSLLERIKLKEKLEKEKNAERTPEMEHQKYLEEKLPALYDIIYQISVSNRLTTSYSLTKLTQMIVDSFQYPIDIQDIHDGLKLMTAKLSESSKRPPIQIKTSNNLSVVTFDKLNREENLKILRA